MDDDDEVRRSNRPICGKPAWGVGDKGFIIEWSPKEGLFTAYGWVIRPSGTVTQALGCGLDFDEAVRLVRRAEVAE